VYDVRFHYPQALFSDLQGANGWVSAELGYGGGEYDMLRARPDSYHVDVWEEFSFVRNTCSSDCWTIRNLWNNRWVSAELGHGGASNGMLRARRVQCGSAHARGFG